jgi:cell division protein FtsW (lipid II flippase)
MSGVDRRARAVAPGRYALANAGWLVVGSALALSVIGIYTIDVSSGMGSGGPSRWAVRQAVFLVIGVAAAGAVAWPSYRRAIPLVWVFGLAVVGLLVFVLLPFVPEEIVRAKNGARRWINVGVTEFQPSELAKVAFVLVMASYLRYRRNHRSVRGLVGPSLIAFVPMGLILVEPDLGTATLFVPTLLAMLVAAGARLKHLVSAGVLAGVFAAVVVLLSLGLAEADRYPLLREHQVERIRAVIDQFRGDERFVQDRGFQGRQAMTLGGAGGVWGHGEEHSRALAHFSALPERHNDMIFAVLLNRFGFVGAAVTLGLYLVWVLGALLVAANCKDPFGRLVAVGIAAIVAAQMGVNVGMTLGLLPITGMTLPFVSYGGSSLVVVWMMVGLVVNVGIRRPAYLWQKSFEFDDEVG